MEKPMKNYGTKLKNPITYAFRLMLYTKFIVQRSSFLVRMNERN